MLQGTLYLMQCMLQTVRRDVQVRHGLFRTDHGRPRRSIYVIDTWIMVLLVAVCDGLGFMNADCDEAVSGIVLPAAADRLRDREAGPAADKE